MGIALYLQCTPHFYKLILRRHKYKITELCVSSLKEHGCVDYNSSFNCEMNRCSLRRLYVRRFGVSLANRCSSGRVESNDQSSRIHDHQRLLCGLSESLQQHRRVQRRRKLTRSEVDFDCSCHIHRRRARSLFLLQLMASLLTKAALIRSRSLLTY